MTEAGAGGARTVVVSGSASGIGAAVASQLRETGARVVGIDLRGADVLADLSTSAGRRDAVASALEATDGVVDALVTAAGIGPGRGRERALLEVNYFGTVELLEGLRPALARAGSARVVAVASNSTSTSPLVPAAAVRALLLGDLDAAERVVRRRPGMSSTIAYAASKTAVTRWARRAAVTQEWIGAGINLNVISPGAIATPLLDDQLAGPYARAVRNFPIPAGAAGSPDVVAAWIVMLLSPAAAFAVGTNLVLDGGTDAYLRADDWPTRLPLRVLPRVLRPYR